jgi:uncharacterized membrane protein YphA (DoxX/SURF4 family)
MASVDEQRAVRRDRVLDVVGLAARLVLAGCSWSPGSSRRRTRAQTKVAVRAYQLLPDGVVDAVAAVLPYLEIATGALLLLGLATRLAGILAGLLMIAFLIGVGSAAARG